METAGKICLVHSASSDHDPEGHARSDDGGASIAQQRQGLPRADDPRGHHHIDDGLHRIEDTEALEEVTSIGIRLFSRLPQG